MFFFRKALPPKLFLFVVLWLSSTFSSVGQGVQEFYSLSRSPRALGMGNTFYSVSNDEYALFYNPAGLARYPQSFQLLIGAKGEPSQSVLASSSRISDMIDLGSNLEALVQELETLRGQTLSGGASFFPHLLFQGFAVGIFADAKVNTLLRDVSVGSEVDVTGIVDGGLIVGKSFSAGKQVHFGINTKLLFRGGGRRLFSALDIAQNIDPNVDELSGYGAGIDFDLGMIWEMKRPPFGEEMGLGLSINNVLATKYPLLTSSSSAKPPQLPRMVSLGSYVVFKGNKTFHDILVQWDFSEFSLGGQSNSELGARKGSVWKHINFGVEVPVWSWLYLRSGFRQGLVTGGLGFSFPFMKLDFATYGEELGREVGRFSVRRYVVQLMLGYQG